MFEVFLYNNSVKKLLLLGGSNQQIDAIKVANESNIYTILCDYLNDNPGQKYANAFYCVSTTDKEKVLEIAKKEKINGIVSYSSDPAAPTAAYIAQELNLPGIPYNIARVFCNKYLFRNFLKEHDFNYPQSFLIEKDMIEIYNNYPAIVKPVDSSGSKGVKVVNNKVELSLAFNEALKYSREKKCIIENYIEKDHDDVIEAEIFVQNGEVVVWGIMNTIRNNKLNPLVPASYCFPSLLPKYRLDLVKKEINRLLKVSNINNGAFNIEMIISKDDKVYFLDVGPRNGGNMLPVFIGDIYGCNLIEATIKNAIGELKQIRISNSNNENMFYGLKIIYSKIDGYFNGVEYSSEAKKYLYKDFIFKKKGDKINKFSNARDAIGLAFFKFPSREIQSKILRDFDEKYIIVGYNN